MPRFAANTSMLFLEHPFVERLDRAAAAGFRAVEFQFPYAEDIDGIVAALGRNSLQQVLFNVPAGDFAAGDRGIANDPRRVDEFRAGVERAVELAGRFGTPKLNCLVGRSLPDVRVGEQWDTVRDNLAWAAERTATAHIQLVIEPLNPFDAPGFLLATPHQGFALVEDVGHPNLSVQYDLYHAQRTEGNLSHAIQQHIGQIGHIQVADSPLRNEPGTGEINYPYMFEVIDAAGYDGWVGLEYKPSADTVASLHWLRDLGYWPA